MKHKHSELIKKWADGVEIEVKTQHGWSYCPNPNWSEMGEYRISPQEITELWTIKEGIIVKAVWDADKTRLISVELVK